MFQSLPDLLNHILDEINYLINDSEALSEDLFMRDERLKRAFSRSLEIIGEASKLIPEEFKKKVSGSCLEDDGTNAGSADPPLFWCRLSDDLGYCEA